MCRIPKFFGPFRSGTEFGNEVGVVPRLLTDKCVASFKWVTCLKMVCSSCIGLKDVFQF